MQAFRWVLAVLLVAIGVLACGSSKEDDEITFSKTIEPLVQEKCQRCHREGGLAPFALVSYAEVKRMAGIAKDKIVSREMPPWGAFDDAACDVKRDFRDDLSLTQEQIDLFTKWVEQGMKEGDPAQRPPPRSFPPDGLLDKTHTFEMATPYEVIGGGPDDIRCFPIDPGFTEDTWIGASNVVPGDPRVVHHVIVYVDPNGEGAAKAGTAGNYPCFGGPDVSDPSLLLAWAPGVPPTTYGDEAGIKVEKGSKLIAQVHYHPTATTVTDKTTFELKKLSYKPGYVAQVVLVGNASDDAGEFFKLMPGPNDRGKAEFHIPANAKNHTETMELVLPKKVGDFEIPPLSIYAVGAHMHWAGVDMKIEIERQQPTAEQPAKECLLGTPKYDFNWQRGYAYQGTFDQLPLVTPGDKIRFTCTYDNTTANRYVRKAMSESRLSSPVDIGLGETTLDEMCLGVLVTVRRASLLD
jgi:hypothetical protein